jgi:hypothetical protein
MGLPPNLIVSNLFIPQVSGSFPRPTSKGLFKTFINIGLLRRSIILHQNGPNTIKLDNNDRGYDECMLITKISVYF